MTESTPGSDSFDKVGQARWSPPPPQPEEKDDAPDGSSPPPGGEPHGSTIAGPVGSWSPPQPPLESRKRPVWQHRWVLITVALLLVALVTGFVQVRFSVTTSSSPVSANASGTLNAHPAPDGFQTVSSARGGYSVAVPETWVVLDLSTDTLAEHAQRLESTEPYLAGYFSSSIYTDDAGLPYTDFFAADPDGSTPTPSYVRAEHFAQQGNPVDHMADIRATLEAMSLTEIDVRRASIGGRDGVLASGVAVGTERSPRYVITNAFVECRPDVQCIIVFNVPESSSNRSIVDEMIRNVSFG